MALADKVAPHGRDSPSRYEAGNGRTATCPRNGLSLPPSSAGPARDPGPRLSKPAEGHLRTDAFGTATPLASSPGCPSRSWSSGCRSWKRIDYETRQRSSSWRGLDGHRWWSGNAKFAIKIVWHARCETSSTRGKQGLLHGSERHRHRNRTRNMTKAPRARTAVAIRFRSTRFERQSTMGVLEFLILKAVVLCIAVAIYGFWRGRKGL